jgi:hypothetical protein
MIKRHKSLAALAVIVIVALISFGLAYLARSTRSSSPKVNPQKTEHLQEIITGLLRRESHEVHV